MLFGLQLENEYAYATLFQHISHIYMYAVNLKAFICTNIHTWRFIAALVITAQN
jgi:hypothetical protein